MEQYSVTGMSCAACQARVEKAVSGVEGVTSCSVSLLTNSMGVEGNADSAAIIKAVEEAGYGASKKGASSRVKNTATYSEDDLADKETPVLKKRLISSLLFLVVLMYFSMGYMMLKLPLPEFFDKNHLAIGIVELLLAGIIMVINQKFFISGFKGLIHLSPNMDTLVALGSGVSYAYSVVMLLLMSGEVMSGNSMKAMEYMDEFYFESAAMILALITVGKMLESISKGKTTNALKSLMKLAPKTASVLRDGKETIIDASDVTIGDVFLVRPGESIPVDGIVIEGESAVNESALTGESIPVDKSIDSHVSAGTINQSGFLKCSATKVGADTTLSQIIQMVSDAAATKAPIAKTADKVSGVFVPAVIGIAFVTFAIWILTGQTLGFALSRAITVLVISCPCALGLATPVAIMVGNGVGAKNGIMFKTSAALEQTGKTNIVVLDKTGTITEGNPVVTDIYLANSKNFIKAEDICKKPELVYDRNLAEEMKKLLDTAYSMEKKSEHPLAKAVNEFAEKNGIEGYEVRDFKALFGSGVKATTNDLEITGGSLSYINREVKAADKDIADAANSLSEEGKTPLVFAEKKGDKEYNILGMMAVADPIKEDSKAAIKELQDMGMYVVMLTGDNKRCADAIGKEAGTDSVISEVLPEGKEKEVRRLQQYGKVIMVGDGINDAPALTAADMGIAIGAGTDVAIDAADVVLVKSRLKDVPAAIRLSRETLKNIHENLFWAFFYNIILIPLAAGLYTKLFGWTLNPMIGAAAMSLSSFCVVMNALRLNLFDIRNTRHDRKYKNKNGTDYAGIQKMLENEKKKNNNKEANINMATKTMTIKGMMCEHCEATVKKALEKLDFVQSAEVSHEKGTAVVTLSGDCDDAVLKQAVEDRDYEVTEIA